MPVTAVSVIIILMNAMNLPDQTNNDIKTEEHSTSNAAPSQDELRQQRKTVVAAIIGVVVILGLGIGFIIFLLQPATPTDKIRDIFIIFMALETLLIGLVLVILIIQLARLLNLLQNEIKPILKSTNEGVNTLRGTIIFISDNIAEPVMKLNESLAALRQVVGFIRFTKKK